MVALGAIALLIVLLPFEPMEPSARVLGLEMSQLELAALLLLVVAASAFASRRSPVALAVPALGFLGAVFLSAMLADGGVWLPVKFSLRMTAAVAALALTSLALSSAPRFTVFRFAFTAAGLVTALIALAEYVSVPGVDAVVAPFREHAFEVGGRHRASATFSYPNTTGGFLAMTLPFAMSFLVQERLGAGVRAWAFLISVAIFGAVVVTYSRGALLAAIVSAVALTLCLRRKELVAANVSFVLVTIAILALDPSFRWRASSEDDRTWYRAAIEPQSTFLELDSAELIETRVRVRNNGALTWSSTGGEPFHLSHRWFRLTEEGSLSPVGLEGERTRIGDALAPGDAAELTAVVRAPPTQGWYVLIWDMVHEHTTWFSDKVGLGTPVYVSVGVAPPADVVSLARLEKTLAARAWRPGRAELWSIAIGLFAEHPIVGIGPDNFRWQYGARAGRSDWDTRVFSNSLYLELLATTGIVGFAAFAVLVASAFLGLGAALRIDARRLDAAVTAAAIAGFLAHGLFDYLLAFTPIYLAVFILLGAASALSGGAVASPKDAFA